MFGFSRGSRRRLLFRLSELKRQALTRALFVTLTYPASYSPDPEVWKENLELWWLRLRRKYPGASCIWRLEEQPGRGAPHFHLLVFGVGFIPYAWVGESWASVVGRGCPDAAHAAAGTSVERVRSVRHAVGYAAKYLSKTGECAFRSADGRFIPCPGRLWGCKGRCNLPICPVRSFFMVHPQTRRDVLDSLQGLTGRSVWRDDQSHRYLGGFCATDVLALCLGVVDASEWWARKPNSQEAMHLCESRGW